MLRQLENCLEELSREPTQLRGALHVGIVPFLDVALLPKLLGGFVAAHPGSDSQYRNSPRPISRRRWKKAGCTWALVSSPPLAKLRYDPLWRDEISLIIPASHPWAKRSFVNLHELHEQRLLQTARYVRDPAND